MTISRVFILGQNFTSQPKRVQICIKPPSQAKIQVGHFFEKSAFSWRAMQILACTLSKNGSFTFPTVVVNVYDHLSRFYFGAKFHFSGLWGRLRSVIALGKPRIFVRAAARPAGGPRSVWLLYCAMLHFPSFIFLFFSRKLRLTPMRRLEATPLFTRSFTVSRYLQSRNGSFSVTAIGVFGSSIHRCAIVSFCFSFFSLCFWDFYNDLL